MIVILLINIVIVITNSKKDNLLNDKNLRKSF